MGGTAIKIRTFLVLLTVVPLAGVLHHAGERIDAFVRASAGGEETEQSEVIESLYQLLTSRVRGNECHRRELHDGADSARLHDPASRENDVPCCCERFRA